MKLALLAIILTGCAAVPLSPTAVSPAATDIANNIKAVIAAANGDCSLPVTPSSMAAACVALPDATTTQQQNIDSIIACVLAGGNTRFANTFLGLKAGLCPTTAAPIPVAPPAAVKPAN